MGSACVRGRRSPARRAIGAGFALVALIGAVTAYGTRAAPFVQSEALSDDAARRARWESLRVVAAEEGENACLAFLRELCAAGAADETTSAPLFVDVARRVTASPAFARLPSAERADLLEAALRAAVVAGDLGMRATFALRLAPRLAAAGRVEDACRVLEDLLKDLPARGGPLPAVLRQLADYALFRGEYDRALELVARAREALDQSALQDSVRSRIEGSLGEAWLALGLVDQAERAFEAERVLVDALRARDAQSPYLYSNARASELHRAQLWCANESYERLEREVGAWLERPQYASASAWRAALSTLLGVAQAQLERRDPTRPVRSAETLRRAIEEPEAEDSFRRYAHLWNAKALLSRGEVAEAERALERATVSSTAAIGPLVANVHQAYEAALRSAIVARGADETARASALAELRVAWSGLIERWKRVPARAEGLAPLQYLDTRFVLCSLVREEIEQGGSQAGTRAAFDALIEAQALGSLPRLLSAPSTSLEDVRASLAPKEGWLFYLPGPDDSHVFLLDAAGLAHVLLPTRYALDPAREELAAARSIAADAAASEGARAREHRAAGRVASWTLPPPVQERLSKWGTLTVVGAELLKGVFFEDLPLSNGRTLIEEHPVRYLPSASVQAALLTRRKTRESTDGSPARLVVVHDSRPSDRARAAFAHAQPPPSLRKEEIASLCKAWSGSSGVTDGVVLLERADATPARVAAELARGAGALFTLAHGVFDGERSCGAGVLLAGTGDQLGTLWSDELAGWPLPPLVVLAVCGAADGPARGGDAGSGSLEGALLRGGCEVALVSPDELAFEPTRRVAWRFLEILATSEPSVTPAEALRLAELEIAHADGEAGRIAHSRLHVVGLGASRFGLR